MKLLNSFALLVGLVCSTFSFSQFSFTPSVTSGCAPLSIDFNNTSTGGVHYNWDFGDGTYLSDITDPSHTFLNGGNYSVTMFAEDASFNYLGQTEMDIEVVGAPASINMTLPTVCPNDVVNMWVYVPGAISYSWDFDDGQTASGSDYVSHVYNVAGEFHPTVTITTVSCGTFVVQDTITVSGTIPYFGGNPFIGISSLSVCPSEELTGYTDDSFQNFDWDFGDGNTDNGDYVTFSYGSVGNYNVQLTITNGCGIDTVLTDVVSVSAGTPVIGGYIDGPDSICPGEEFYMWSNANNGVSFEWDMGDASPLVTNSGNMEYTYPVAGTYNVSVTITNDCGNTDVVSQTIVVTTASPVYNPSLWISETNVCPGDIVSFQSNSEYTYYIDYGDGSGASGESEHAYSNPGTYTVTSTIQNACGNSVVLTETITVSDNLPINTTSIYVDVNPDEVCPGQEVDFYTNPGYASYLWDFGDGVTSINQNTQHTYNTIGIYNGTVTIVNGCGNQATFPAQVDVQGNLPVGDIGFQVFGDTICPGDAMYFEADADDGDFDYLWTFGDGATSTFLNVSHVYDNVGTYPIELTVTNGCGNDSTFFDTLVVSTGYMPDASNYNVFAQEEGCIGDELYFVLMPAGAGVISWDFGDGNSTSDVDQVLVQGITPVDVAFHAYNTVGNYYAVYTITNACGNTVVDSVLITVGTVGDDIDMDVSFWWDESQTSCQGQPIEFMAVGGASYVWDFGDGSGTLLTNSSLSPVFHTYADPGNYLVSVTSYNQCGLSDDSDENIFIPQSQMDVSTNTVIESNCGENNGMAIVSVSGGAPPYSYSWTSGDTGVIADSLASGIYVVTVTDNNGCSNEGIATVSDEEGVVILVDNIVDVNCFGNDNGSISVSILGGQPPYTILWSNGDQTEDIFGLQAGPYEIFVTDANGCFAVQSIEVTQPQKSNVSVITTAATCGSTNGSAVASVNNGTGPYNFIWPNTTGPSNTTGGLAPGTYSLLVIDGNTCLLEKDFVINETNSAIIITDSTVTGTCNGTLSSIYLSTIGGVAPFTYNWSDASTSQDLTGVLPGEYDVQITGSNGCSSFAQFTVIESLPEETTICMVDVDTLTGTNLIVWVPVNDPGIASYNIYKESSEAGLYYLIGNSDADSLSQYFDYLSDPSIRSWRYRVAAVDDCGNQAPLSAQHKTIHLTSNMGISGEVNLIWDHYQGFAYPTYYVNRYHPNTGWEVIDSLASNLFSYTDQNPPGDSSLVYMITINTPGTCTALKATDYNSSRSNREGINMPDNGDDGSGIDELSSELLVYPNPTNSMVKIVYTSDVKEIAIYDLAGKVVYRDVNLSGNTIEIDMSAFERGIYNFTLIAEGKILNGKVIRN